MWVIANGADASVGGRDCSDPSDNLDAGRIQMIFIAASSLPRVRSCSAGSESCSWASARRDVAMG